MKKEVQDPEPDGALGAREGLVRLCNHIRVYLEANGGYYPHRRGDDTPEGLKLAIRIAHMPARSEIVDHIQAMFESLPGWSWGPK